MQNSTPCATRRHPSSPPVDPHIHVQMQAAARRLRTSNLRVYHFAPSDRAWRASCVYIAKDRPFVVVQPHVLQDTERILVFQQRHLHQSGPRARRIRVPYYYALGRCERAYLYRLGQQRRLRAQCNCFAAGDSCSQVWLLTFCSQVFYQNGTGSICHDGLCKVSVRFLV